jgi:hypothetical protein
MIGLIYFICIFGVIGCLLFYAKKHSDKTRKKMFEEMNDED